MARMVVLDADGVAVNAVEAETGWAPGPGFTAVRHPTAAVGQRRDPATGAFSWPARPVEERRAARLALVQAQRGAIMAAGAPFGGKWIEMDDATRTNLAGMASAAALARLGVLPWPESYSTGWITMDNSRIPLPSPMAGIALAATVGEYYGGIVQRGRDLKDAVLAADDPDAVALDWGAFGGR